MPGALTMTGIDVRDDEKEALMQLHGQGVVEQLAAEPGFLGWVGTSAGRRMHTLTA